MTARNTTMRFTMEPYESRRQALLARLDRAVAVFPSAPVTIRNNDVTHPFRQDSDLYYLTGLDEPECALVLSSVHPEVRSAIFVRPRNPEREQWDGPRLGVDEAAKRLGVDTAYAIDELEAKLPDFLQGARRLVVRLGRNPAFDSSIHTALDQTRARWKTGIEWPTEIVDPARLVHEMRMRKDEHELGMMRRAAAITAEAHREAMRVTRPGMLEYEIEALLTHVYRSRGASGHAFEPIVASGANATILHYTCNRRTIADRDLVLIDSGCEFEGYAADVTRTFPASGKFTAEQREIYELVLQAQREAIDRTRPGASLEQIHTAVCATLVDGLVKLGLLTGARDELLQDQSYKRFFPHRTGHWLGLDVHDVGLYFPEGKPRLLEPGMIITVEPGLYIPPTGDQAPKRFQGIGIRIEDNVLVTPDGCEELTQDIPKQVSDVEAMCDR